MKMRAFSQREKMILYVTLSLSAVSIIANFGVSPVVFKIGDINNTIERKRRVLKKYVRLINKGDDITSLYEQYRDELETDGKGKDGVADLFEEIKAGTGRYNLIIEKIRPLAIKEKEEYKEVSLEIIAEGGFTSIFKFITYLESLPSLIRISSFQLSPQAGESALLRCRITLSKIFLSDIGNNES